MAVWMIRLLDTADPDTVGRSRFSDVGSGNGGPAGRSNFRTSPRDALPTRRFVAVHVDRLPEVADEWSVMATPTLVYVREGEERHRTAGAVTPSMVQEALDAVG